MTDPATPETPAASRTSLLQRQGTNAGWTDREPDLPRPRSHIL